MKLPGTVEGRSPYDDALVRDAHQKADDAGVQYFFTSFFGTESDGTFRFSTDVYVSGV